MHLDAATLFRHHATFVAGFLARLGVARASLDDAVQEVFPRGSSARRLRTDDSAGDDLARRDRLARRGRRRCARARRDARAVADGVAEKLTSADPSPFDRGRRRRRARPRRSRARRTGRASSIRAVFLLYEVEEESCEAIADALGVPLGTVHSRLHHARRAFEKAFARLERQTRPLSVAMGAR